MENELSAQQSGGGQVIRLAPDCWRLAIPSGPSGLYRLAQVSDAAGMPRGRLKHQAPFQMRMRARASSACIPGTWGFGLWNNPFGLGIGQGGGLILPELPNAAWFFNASNRSYLSLRDNLPGNGFLIQVFRSPPLWPFLPMLPGALLLAWPAAARLVRRMASAIVREAGACARIDVTVWHEYRLNVENERVLFTVDDQYVLETSLVPRGRLGLVIWIDNQFAAFGPDGRLRAGTLETSDPAWIEVDWIDSRG